MGSLLDGSKDIRQNKKNPSRQAHKIEEELEKDKDKGVKMNSSTENQGTMKFTLEHQGIVYDGIGIKGLEGSLIAAVFGSKKAVAIPDDLRAKAESMFRSLGFTGTVTYVTPPTSVNLCYVPETPTPN